MKIVLKITRHNAGVKKKIPYSTNLVLNNRNKLGRLAETLLTQVILPLWFESTLFRHC